ncbi:MAG: serine/threonine protein kinase [Oscillospiraceae bacterium]|jgi:serine/threonine protein kinase|nr:serine/threonine protein kinase [Oscillospiraceae bacterium]
MDEQLYIDNKFPSYQIIELLSDNPTSRVFLSEREDKLYVIKQQPRQFCFLKNPAALCELEHPGLPKIIDFFETDESFFYSYEYINGVTLTDAYESGLITTGAAVAITEKLCAIVSYLHGKSLLHCDIKPDNIIINGDNVYLIDFGIAHFYDKNGGSETALIGTEGFVTPELGYRKTDYRADVYSLGMVLFYLLTGSMDIKELSERVSDRALRDIVGRAANYEVGKRYKNVAKLQSALEKYRKGTTYRPFFAAIIAAALALCFMAGGLILPALKESLGERFGSEQTTVYEFSDPIIEQAIRLNLGKTAEEPVYPHELLGVESIFIAEDKAFATWEEQDSYCSKYNDGSLSPRYEKFVSTADLAACKNIKSLNIQYNSLEDISFLNEHIHLRALMLDYTGVNDISVIRNFSMLNSLGLSGCPVSDLSPIKDCPMIEHLNLNHVIADNFDFAVPGKSFAGLSIGYVNYDRFISELSGITVDSLFLDGCGLTGFDLFPDLTVTEALIARNNNLSSTEGSERILAAGAQLVLE